jgi:hypothetical protein
MMNTENSHNAKTPSLDRLYLPGTPVAKPLLGNRKQIPSAARSFAVPLTFQQARRFAPGNKGYGFGLYFQIQLATWRSGKSRSKR